MAQHSAIKVADFYRISWQLLLVVCCAVAMLAQAARPLVLLPSFLLAVLIMSTIDNRWQRHKQRIAIAIGSMLLTVVGEQALHLARREDMVGIMIELICGALPWLLLSHNQPRSYWLAILNVVIIGVGSMTLAANTLVYIGFILLICLVMLNLNAANLYLASGGQNREDLPSGYFRQFIYVMPVGLISALAIFFIFPRVQSFTMALGRHAGSLTTGYSGLVELTGSGPLQTSQAVAFMVESSDKEWLRQGATSLLFRGDSLATFDGVHWSNTIFDFRPSEVVADLAVASKHTKNLRQATVHLEPAATAAIFYPDILVSIFDPAPGPTHFLTNANGSVIRDPFQYERFTYELRTADTLSVAELPAMPLREIRALLQAVPRPLPHQLGRRDLPSYLAIPPTVLGSAYFQAWLKEVDLDPAVATLAEAEQRLTRLFTTRFQTTLNNHFTGTDKLASFLGKERRGHCEYFATTAALTLRALGVPTRLVVGYNGGTFNDLVDVLEVRDEDAHAWVEAYLPEVGWHAFNPTPANSFFVTSATATLRLLLDGTSFWLRRYVIDYDQSTQRELLQRLRELGRAGTSGPTDLQPLLQRSGRVVAAMLLLLGGLYSVRRWLYRTRRADVPAYYHEFLRKAQDLRRGVGETITAYHERLRRGGADATLLRDLEQAIVQDLYGPGQTTNEERSALRRRVREWRPTVKG